MAKKIKLLKLPKSKRKQLLDQWYDDAIGWDAGSEEATTACKNIVDLEEAKKKQKLDPNAVLAVAGSLLGTVLIINAEKVTLISKNAIQAAKPVTDLVFKIVKH